MVQTRKRARLAAASDNVMHEGGEDASSSDDSSVPAAVASPVAHLTECQLGERQQDLTGLALAQTYHDSDDLQTAREDPTFRTSRWKTNMLPSFSNYVGQFCRLSRLLVTRVTNA
ncbi:hypothetical protein GN244_ATG12518 [Phytophthora infestans]|uniref:Uncharacterized protein n=1 Tax=Phytophthora infestans TaxID=4787 RepID=A0A833RY74_PHYIN|nr:hypothetical protein GN244_ATG12518 [Phytophthora infestans]KAF4127337.1 hypothetical protein GN958_ATG23472 [Phytophthora infestans]KAF4137597.1 hypothetical protein GN958_ATG13209 [Phytophthora infestans]